MKKLLSYVVAFVVVSLLVVAFGALRRDRATRSRAAMKEPLSEARASANCTASRRATRPT